MTELAYRGINECEAKVPSATVIKLRCLVVVLDPYKGLCIHECKSRPLLKRTDDVVSGWVATWNYLRTLPVLLLDSCKGCVVEPISC